ncbi:MAG: hypothetical protein AAB353_07725 [Candidatus Hydrogenedentota bacterium]
MKQRPSPARGILFFFLRFALIAPVGLYIWWAYLLPPYAWLVGQGSGVLVNLLRGGPVLAMKIETDENFVLHAKSFITFTEAYRIRQFDVAYLVDSFPAYIILVLATSGLGLWRRLRVLFIGSTIILAGNVTYVSIMYFQHHPPGANTYALGQFWLTLPFILWIVLAYWDRLGQFFGDEEPVAPSVNHTRGVT